MNESVVSIADAAAALGVSRQRVEKLISEGKLVAVEHHRHRYVTLASIAARQQGPPPTERLTTRQVAEKLGVAAATVNTYRKKALLPGAVKEGNTWTFPPDVLDGWDRRKPVVALHARQQPYNQTRLRRLRPKA